MSWLQNEPDFELPPRQERLPDELFLLGQAADRSFLPFQVDADDRLVVDVAGPRYRSAIGPNYISTNLSLIEGEAVQVVELNVANRGNASVRLTLYWSPSLAECRSGNVLLIANLPAKSVYTWQGIIDCGLYHLYGVASADNSLHLIRTTTAGLDQVRT
jgi:hypothetical protein